MSKFINYDLILQSDNVIRATADNIQSEPGQLDIKQIETAKKCIPLINKGALDRELAESLGTFLYNAIFAEPINGHFREQAWRKAIEDPYQETIVCLRLIFQEGVNPEIISMPWEFLYGQETFLGTDYRIALSYKYDSWLKNPFKPYSDDDLPLRVLFVHTHPKDEKGVGKISVRNAIKELGNLAQVNFEELEDPLPKDLQKKIRDYSPHVFHFLGHGKFDEIKGAFALIDEDDNALWYDHKSFSDLFRGRLPGLVVLQSCESGRMSDLVSFVGGASGLAKLIIPAVVGMRYPFEQRYGWEFFHIFYEILGKGDPVDVAVQAGRNALAVDNTNQDHNSRNFGTPVLWMNLEDGLLFHKLELDGTLSNTQIQNQQRAELLENARKISIGENDLEKLYRGSLPPEHFPYKGALTLETILDHLWDIPLQEENKRLPVFEFIERLACFTEDQTLAGELRSKVDELVPLHKPNLRQEDIEKMRTEIKQEGAITQSYSLYLIVEITPVNININSNKENRYRFDISYWKHKDNRAYIAVDDNPYPFVDDKPYPYEHLKQLFKEALRVVAEKFLKEMADLTIEFFLPLELMHCEVEQWCKKHEFLDEIPIGIDHKVVIRSLERAIFSDLQIYWGRKWKHAMALNNKPDIQNIIQIYERDAYQVNELYTKLIASDCICMGLLTFTPECDRERGGNLREIISAGLPIALWHRSNDKACKDLNQIRGKIESIVFDNEVIKLPNAILSERRQAVGRTEHTGNYLTLLWDDPSRLPGNLDRGSNNRLREPKIEREKS